MPGIVNLVAAISVDVNAKLVAAGLPPLVDGGIVIGRRTEDENFSPPRVVFIPKSSRFEARDHGKARPQASTAPQNPGAALRNALVTLPGGGYSGATTVTFSAPPVGVTATAVPVIVNGSLTAIALTNAGSGYIQSAPPTVTIADTGGGTGATAIANVGPTADQLFQMLQRSLFTDVVTFDVICWGVNALPDYSNDFDTAQILYQQVIQSAHLVAPGAVYPKSGQWTEYKEGTTQVDLLGHEYVFSVEIRTPLLDAPLAFVPVGTQMHGTTSFVAPVVGGMPEAGPNF